VSTRELWWMDSGEIARLYEWLCDECLLEPSDVREVAYFLRKPHKWTDEYKAMLAAEDAELEPLLQASVSVARAGVRRFR
jgi:hypothetical protein